VRIMVSYCQLVHYVDYTLQNVMLTVTIVSLKTDLTFDLSAHDLFATTALWGLCLLSTRKRSLF